MALTSSTLSFARRLEHLDPAALDPAYQALAAKMAETEAPGGWRAFRSLVPSSSSAAAAEGRDRHYEREQRPLDVVAALRPAEFTRREWDEEINSALARVEALMEEAEGSLDGSYEVVSAHVSVM